MSLKTAFKQNWAKFLETHFETDEQIGVCFGVTARQARHWRDQVSCPNGAAVALAFSDPELSTSAQQLLRVAAHDTHRRYARPR